MFEMSDDFFKGLGCTPMTEKFWEKSVLKRADGGDQMVCHASAWDFIDGDTTYDGENVLGMWENGAPGTTGITGTSMLVTEVGDKKNVGDNFEILATYTCISLKFKSCHYHR